MSQSEPSQSTRPLFTVANAWPVLEARGWLANRRAEIRQALFGIAQVRSLDAGQHLYTAGSQPNGIFGLVDGALDIAIPRVDGEELTVHRADPGFWIGDLALFSGQKRLVSVRAVKPSRLIELPQQKCQRLVQTRPEIMMDFYELSHRNVFLALQLLGNLSISPSDVRVATRLLLLDENRPADADWISISQEELAGMVALSLPTLQRMLRRLEQEGLIEIGYRQLRILDRAGLDAACTPGFAGIGRVSSGSA